MLDALAVELVEHVDEVLKIALVTPEGAAGREAAQRPGEGLEGGQPEGLTH